jgi:hypothetical protein
MKKIPLLLSLIISLTVKSQITFDFSLPNNIYTKIQTTGLGDKIFGVSPNNSSIGSLGDTIFVYNSNGTFYKKIILPIDYRPSNFQDMLGNNISSLTDELFNSDTSLEVLGIKNVSGSNYVISVFSEQGQIIYTFPDTVYSGYVTLFTLDGQFKIFYSPLSGINKIYSLPGSLPCNTCNSIPSGIIEPNQGSGLSGFHVSPNPFNTELSIEYNLLTNQTGSHIIISDILGRELKSILLTKESDNLSVNTSDLPRGTLIVSLYDGNQNPVSKKVIKIN